MLLTAVVMLMPLHVLAQSKMDEYATSGSDQQDEPAIYVNGELLRMDGPTIVENNRIFVPIRHLTDALYGNVMWMQETSEAMIRSPLGDVMIFQPDNPIMRYNDVEYRMDVAPVTLEGRIYIPLRHAAQFLHAEVEWDATTDSAYLTHKEPYLVQEEDTILSISERYGIEPRLLVERNQLEDREAMIGYPIKYIIPDIMAEKIEEPEEQPVAEDLASEAVVASLYSDEDMLLLAKITMVEAGYEPYEGQLAVANVILNRVEDPRFPDTIRDVIYAPSQFPPAHNGLLDRAEPNESVWEAVKAAVEGENNVKDAVYFHNPDVSSGGFWDRLTKVAEIGNHRFLK